jgi:hypothetical protein
MKYPAATQAQRNRRMRSQEIMKRSHRRSELIRQTSALEDQAFSPAPNDESAGPGSLQLDGLETHPNRDRPSVE